MKCIHNCKIFSIAGLLVVMTSACNFGKKTEYIEIEKTIDKPVEIEKTGFISSSAVQNTTTGFVQGSISTDGVISWLGIPYAEPPVNSLRWKKPVSIKKWAETKDTLSYGQLCTQYNQQGKIVGGEDCLYLNVWRPKSDEINLPIMLFIHGGGNTSGSGGDFPAAKLSKNVNAIIVSINYRLGPLGFINHNSLKGEDRIDNSGNFGLLDIIEALKWVKANAERFGGDRNNITLSGQSAGARDVLALLISPQARGLFNKAIALSGGLTTSTPEDGQQRADKVISEMLVKDGLAANANEAKNLLSDTNYIKDYLRQKSANDLIGAFSTSSSNYSTSTIRMQPFPHLFSDGIVIAGKGYDEFTHNDFINDVPLMLGSNESEFGAFAGLDPDLGVPLRKMIQGDLTSETIINYKAANLYGSQIYNGFVVENVVDRFKNNGYTSPIYGYRFAWGNHNGVYKSPCEMIGAVHGNDLDFFLDTKTTFVNSLFNNCAYYDGNEQGRVALQNAVHSYIKNFLYTGSPNSAGMINWPEAKATKEYIVLDATLTEEDIFTSANWHQKDQILSQMRKDLDAKASELLENKIFAGRFFIEKWF